MKDELEKALEFVGFKYDEFNNKYSEHYIKDSDSIYVDEFKPHVSLDDMAVLENALKGDLRIDYIKSIEKITGWDSKVPYFHFLTAPASIRWQALKKLAGLE